MKIEIEDVSVSYPDEETGIRRRLVIFDDFEYLQFNIFDKSDSNSVGGLTFTKQQVKILRDTFNMMLKNNLIE